MDQLASTMAYAKKLAGEGKLVSVRYYVDKATPEKIAKMAKEGVLLILNENVLH